MGGVGGVGWCGGGCSDRCLVVTAQHSLLCNLFGVRSMIRAHSAHVHTKVIVCSVAYEHAAVPHIACCAAAGWEYDGLLCVAGPGEGGIWECPVSASFMMPQACIASLVLLLADCMLGSTPVAE